ncbi:MAG: hypothetical protein K0R18_1304 [Bacillales bacterium]|jgi:hypothetical protein|nr:hypothetical protein [Bacillales bacterium]
MNEGQEKFMSFIMERVMEGKQDNAKELLAESFDKQQKDEFNKEYLQSFITRMGALLKPEAVEEVMSVMQNFGPSHTN